VIIPGHTIREYVENGLIEIAPHLDLNQIRPCGLRVHLSPSILVAKPNQRIDLTHGAATSDPEYSELDISGKPFVLKPGGFALGSTTEMIRLSPSIICRLDGRSTLARLGLLIHCTSNVIDGVHSEYRSIVLELANVGPFELVLSGGIAIGMAVFETIAGDASVEFEQAQYRGQSGTVPPNLTFVTPRLSDSTK
jgi:dCTP deaminase